MGSPRSLAESCSLSAWPRARHGVGAQGDLLGSLPRLLPPPHPHSHPTLPHHTCQGLCVSTAADSPKPSVLLCLIWEVLGRTLHHHPMTSGKPHPLPSTLEFHSFPSTTNVGGGAKLLHWWPPMNHGLVWSPPMLTLGLAVGLVLATGHQEA